MKPIYILALCITLLTACEAQPLPGEPPQQSYINAAATQTAVPQNMTATAARIIATQTAAGRAANETAEAMTATQAAGTMATATEGAARQSIAVQLTATAGTLAIQRQKTHATATAAAIIDQEAINKHTRRIWAYLPILILGSFAGLVLWSIYRIVDYKTAEPEPAVRDDNGEIVAVNKQFRTITQAIIRQEEPAPAPAPDPPIDNQPIVIHYAYKHMTNGKETKRYKTDHTAAEWKAIATAVYNNRKDQIQRREPIRIAKNILKGIANADGVKIYQNIDQYYGEVINNWYEWELIDSNNILTPHGRDFLAAYDGRLKEKPAPQSRTNQQPTNQPAAVPNI